MNRFQKWSTAIMVTLSCIVTYANAQTANVLLAQHAKLREQLAASPFGQPLEMVSTQGSSRLEGDIHAQIEQSFAVAGPALQDVKNWCDILILHLNTKSCRAHSSTSGDTLALHIGRKIDQPLTSAQPIDFAYTVVESTPEYLQVKLEAKEGPVGTSDYRIVLELAALDPATSFLHLSYSYNYSPVARVAMQSYLATAGRNKVGFSIEGHDDDGKPKYVGGMRGVIERNTMRYYLAIEAWLSALAVPAAQQVDKRLADWFDRSERYPLQLHEIERSEYLAMKHEEIRRQRTNEAMP